jgi:hypothetical protein
MQRRNKQMSMCTAPPTNGRAQYCKKPSTQLVACSGAAHTPVQQAGHARIQVSTTGDTQE